jgi:SWI/SNF-related matrix-associated actin-dependent regulator 1 of chromatin subfamily A
MGRETVAERLARLQFDAIRHLVAHDKAGDFSEMGTGKTRKMIVAADEIGAIDRLIIVPEIARRNWAREHDQWCIGQLETQVVEGSDDRIDDKCPVVILGHGALRHPNIYRQVQRRRWDVMLIDESHAFRKPDAARTMALYGVNCTGKGLVSSADKVWIATGTPMPVGADGLWPFLRALAPQLLPRDKAGKRPVDYEEFCELYCNRRPNQWGGWTIIDSKNLDDLSQRIKPFYVRQHLRDLAPALPPVRYYKIDLTPDARVASEIAKIEDRPEFKALRATLNRILTSRAGYDDEEYEHDDTPLSTLLRLTGVLKAQVVADQLLPELGDNAYEKIVLFAIHHDTMDVLEEKLSIGHIGVVRVDGTTSPKHDQDAIDRFQNDKYPRVFLGQLNKCNTAITLTRANRVGVVELSWIPTLLTQAMARINRIGQKQSVDARLFGMAGSIDGIVAAIVERRLENIAAVFGD